MIACHEQKVVDWLDMAKGCYRIFLLGDIFDFGREKVFPKFTRLLETREITESGIPVIFLGSHCDIWIFNRSRLDCSHGPLTIELGGKQFSWRMATD